MNGTNLKREITSPFTALAEAPISRPVKLTVTHFQKEQGEA